VNLSGKKDKNGNFYLSGHSVKSGYVTIFFAKGSDTLAIEKAMNQTEKGFRAKVIISGL